MRELQITVPPEYDGAQAQCLLKAQGFSRRALIRLKQSGGLTLDGRLLRTIDSVHSGDIISVRLEECGDTPAPSAGLNAEVVYEDEDVIVFDKPPFMPVHPSQRHRSDTLANHFAVVCPGLPFRPINRLDRNTSGLCVCAKNQLSAAALSGSLEKAYYAVTCGTPPGNIVDVPIGRAGDSIIKRCVSPYGKPAVTEYQAVGGNERHTLLRVTLRTGRTHQIRVHMAYLGFPLCGDEMYGGSCEDIGRQALHCGEVVFIQPVTHERIRLGSPLPADMAALLSGSGGTQ